MTRKTAVLVGLLVLVGAVVALAVFLRPPRPEPASSEGDRARETTERRLPRGEAAPLDRVKSEGEDGETTIAGIVLDAGGPVEGAEVVLWSPYAKRGSGRVETLSDAAGRFALEPELPGPFTVVASHERLVVVARDVERGTRDLVLRLVRTASASGVVQDESGTPIAGATIRRPPVTARSEETGTFRIPLPEEGEPLLRISAKGYEDARRAVTAKGIVEVVLEMPIVLKRRPGVYGRVLAPDGSPASDARVSVQAGPFGIQDSDTTDARGRYFLGDAETGEFSLVATHREHAPARREGVHYEKGTRVEVPDIRLRPGGAIEGRVLAADGSPVAEAKLVALVPDPSSVSLLFDQAGSPFVSDGQGRYRITGLATGKHLVRVEAKVYWVLLEKDVEVREGETTALDLTLEPGKVVGGVVLTADGEPARARVDLDNRWDVRSLEDALRRREFDAVRTDEEGRFEFAGLGDEPIMLHVRAEGAPLLTREGVEPGTTDLVLRLERPASVSGRVVDAVSGALIAGAEVTAIDAEIQPGGPPAAPAVNIANSSGAFRLRGLAPGKVTLSASADDYATGSVEIEVESGKERTDVEIRLVRGERLTVLVVAAATGRPVAKASVSIDGEGGESGRTDEGGRFEARNLRPGSYDLRVESEEFAAARVAGVAVPAPRPVRVELTAGGSIRGTVRDADGRPIRGAQFVLQTQGRSRGQKQTRSDANGGFRFDHVAAGAHMVFRVDFRKGPQFEMRRVTVVEGEETTVEFGGPGTEARATLTGRVLDRGKPMSMRVVLLLPLDGSGETPFKMTTTDGEGRFRVEDLAPGRYRVLTGSQGASFDATTSELEIGSGGEVTQDIVLPEGRLVGKVVAAGDGNPVPDAEVVLLDPASAARPARTIAEFMGMLGSASRTGADGKFEFANAPTGRHHLLVTTEGHARAPRIVENVEITRAGADLGTIALEAGQAVAIGVTDAAGAPIPNATVLVLDARGRPLSIELNEQLETGPDGTVKVRLSAGTYRIAAQTPRHAPATRTVTVRGDTETTIALEAGGTILVRAAGDGSAGADVRLYAASGEEIVRRMTQETALGPTHGVRTGEDGTLEIPHVPSGRVRVRVRARDGRTKETVVEVQNGGRVEAVVPLE